MAIRIEKTFQVQEPVESVWKLLIDPRKVASCVPGAKITESVDERTYKGFVRVQVGPSITDYKGQLQVERIDEQNHEIEIAGKGQDVRGKGSASMKMTGKVQPLPDGGSEVVSVSEVNVVGFLAQMGARMINEVSNKIFAEFTVNVRVQLEQGRFTGSDATPAQTGTEEPQPIDASRLALSVAKDSVTKLVQQVFKKS
jgi:carbon monoxide dehydrogenase subunit G